MPADKCAGDVTDSVESQVSEADLLERLRSEYRFASPVVRAAGIAMVGVGGAAFWAGRTMSPAMGGGVTVLSAGAAVMYLAGAARRLTVPLRELDAARTVLARRASAMDHLLDFSEALQGLAGFDDVLDELSHRLWNELDLAGLAIVANDDPPQGSARRARWQVRLCWPDTLAADGPAGEDDKLLNLPPECDAHCIRLNVGNTRQYRIHLLMPLGMEWTDHRLQVAQTYVNTAHAVLSMMHHLDEAERLSVTDGLTQLFNRRSMDEMLRRELALAQRHGHPLSLVMIDMDRFKDVNDAYGHAAGDRLLQTFAECVRLTLRRTDLAFRYGGDEFCIALPNTPITQAQQVVSKLRHVFSTADFSEVVGVHEPTPTLSIGVAQRSPHDRQCTAEQLLAAADQALYDAKHADRDCVRIYRESVG